MIVSSIVYLTLLVATITALPQPLSERTVPKVVTTISSSELSGFAPYTQFARATYCDTGPLATWTCGEACNAISGFKPSLVGGNDDSIQNYFVGYWSTMNSVVVAHEGTDPTELLSDLTDVDIITGTLDSKLFPGVPSDVEVHSGFQDEQAATASAILAEVQSLMKAHSTTSVTVVGHSLGGALAEIDSVFFKLNLPSSTTITTRTYGTPRVGNTAWAEYFDSLNIDFLRINNEYDIIPIVPGRFLGFTHPSGEVHILSPGDAVECPGEDDATDSKCQIQSVPNIFEGDILDHLGPYQGIYIGTIYCT